MIGAIFGTAKKLKEEIAGIKVRHSLRARKMSLSFDIKSNDVILTMPKRASELSAEKFIREHVEWIERVRTKYQSAKTFADGFEITVYGDKYIIQRRDGRGISTFEGNKLVVYGREDFVSRRVQDFLKKVAEEKISQHLQSKIDLLQSTKKISFRLADPKSRWGSCGPDGKMMFSWRLVLMPVFVLDYIVAHEAAHLRHMNHGRDFWRLCYELTEDALSAKLWVKKHGSAVMGCR